MRRYSSSLYAALCAALGGLCPVWLSAQKAPVATPLAFTGVTVVDVRHGKHLPHRTVLVADGRIRAVEPVGRVRIPKGTRVVDARTKYLIPGLWDLHVHPHEHVDIAYPLFIANGVTGVRDAGSGVPLVTLVQWKREIAAGTRVGPRVLVSGQSIGGTQSDRCAEATIIDSRHYLCVGTPAQARLVVNMFKTAGADFIKTYDLSRELQLAVAAEARRLSIPFGGHVDHMSGLEFSDSGAALLDHRTWFAPDVCGDVGSQEVDASLAACAAAAARLRRNGTWVTLMAFLPPLVRSDYLARARRYTPASFQAVSGPAADASVPSPEPGSTADWRALFRGATGSAAPFVDQELRVVGLLHRAGVPVVVGTDAGIPRQGLRWTSGFAVPEALAEFVVAGMSPLAALQAATLNPALALGATDSLGTVEVGKVADLVLLDADPLTDIWNTTRIHAVVANGRYYDRAALDRLLAEAEREAARR